jgi:FixJ family two-component response regulator
MNLRYKFSHSGSSSLPEAAIVFVVDGDAAIREELQSLIHSAGWEARVAASAEEFLAGPRAMAPCCLLTELHLPGQSGLDLQRLVFERTEMPVIFMSSGADVRTTVQAMKGGALEFLTKPLSHEVLLATIREALERSRAALRHLTQVRALQERYESLTRRQREVMSLVVSGRLNKQVSGELGITEFTVKRHRGRLMQKMQAGSFAELVKMATALSA